MDFERTKDVLPALEKKGVDFDGIEVTVVTPKALYRMKRDTLRPRDRADADRLRHRFGAEVK